MHVARQPDLLTHRGPRRWPRTELCLVALGIATLGPATAAVAATAVKPSVPAGFTITKLAAAPNGATNCDDLTSLENHLFMACQNKTMSNGGGGNSTVVEYSSNGAVVKTWSLKDKTDGIGADPLSHRVIVTLDEDANSHLATITPSAPSAQQVVNYAYSPDPHSASAPTALRTGGGTDSVVLDSAGHVFITASHAGTKTGTAVFKVVLTPPSSPTGTGTAALSPTFSDNASAANGNKGSGTVKLALGDVDSGAIVPASSPLHGGSFVIDDQTALQLVFAANINAGTGLTVLKTGFGLDDIRWATSNGGTLYVVNNGGKVAGASAVYKVAGPFTTGTALASNDGQGDQVVKVNLATGALTPFVRGLTTTKGLVYLDASGSEAPLTLAGSTPATQPVASNKKSSSGGSNATVIVVIIIAALLLVGGGAFAIMRRRPRTS